MDCKVECEDRNKPPAVPPYFVYGVYYQLLHGGLYQYGCHHVPRSCEKHSAEDPRTSVVYPDPNFFLGFLDHRSNSKFTDICFQHLTLLNKRLGMVIDNRNLQESLIRPNRNAGSDCSENDPECMPQHVLSKIFSFFSFCKQHALFDHERPDRDKTHTT